MAFESVILMLYVVIVVIGVTGNTLVIAVVKRETSMHSTTNYLLVNLAVGDIVTLLSYPAIYAIPLGKSHPAGLTGDILCKLFTGNEVVDVATSISILTLTFLAIERYHALVKPLKNNLRLTPENLPHVLTILWLVAVIVSIPGFFQFSYDESKMSCVGPWGTDLTFGMAIFALFMVLFFALIPFLIITFCYSKMIKGMFYNVILSQGHGVNERDKLVKQKLIKLFVSITVGFFICHGPFTIFMIYIASRKLLELAALEDPPAFIAFQVVSFLSLTNACINPILYAFQSSNYRRGFKRIFMRLNLVSPAETTETSGNNLVGTTRFHLHK